MAAVPVDTVSVADTFATWGGFIADIIQAAAIVVGGIWAYRKFIMTREDKPRATLEHTIEHFDLADGRRLLRVVEKVANPGPTLLELRERRTRIQQLIPPDEDSLVILAAGKEQEAPWLQLAHHEAEDPALTAVIEPGESDQFEHDFLVDSEPEVVQIYSYFRNVTREEKDVGWSKTTTYRFATTEPETETSSNLRLKEE